MRWRQKNLKISSGMLLFRFIDSAGGGVEGGPALLSNGIKSHPAAAAAAAAVAVNGETPRVYYLSKYPS